MYLFFDTETTGLPRNWKAPITDLDNWPRMIQLAYLLSDNDGNKLAGGDFIIKPAGFTIPDEAARIHGISTERALREGLDLQVVLKEFQAAVGRAQYLVAHNIDFDEKIIGSELLRQKLFNPITTADKICTMKTSAAVVKISNNRGGYKWPNLMELYQHLFKTNFSEAHDAVYDVRACAECFFELKRRGEI